MEVKLQSTAVTVTVSVTFTVTVVVAFTVTTVNNNAKPAYLKIILSHHKNFTVTTLIVWAKNSISLIYSLFTA